MRILLLLRQVAGCRFVSPKKATRLLIKAGVSYHERRKYMAWLLRENWMGYDSEHDVLVLRGFSFFAPKSHTRHLGVKIPPQVLSTNQAWTDFIFSEALKLDAGQLAWRKRDPRPTQSISPSGDTGSAQEITVEYALSIYQRHFHCAKSTASRRRKRVCQHGDVSTQQSFLNVDWLNRCFRQFGIHAARVAYHEATDCGHHVRIIDGQAVVCMPSVVSFPSPTYPVRSTAVRGDKRPGRRDRRGIVVRTSDGRFWANREK